MEVKPLLNCTDPQYIYNKYTHEYKLVNCGKCEACIIHKQRNTSLRCQLESKCNKYCMFVTLTYSNDYLPLSKPLHSDNGNVMLFNVTERLKKYYPEDLILSDVDINPTTMDMLVEKFNMNGLVPYLATVDSQNFLKRFRKNLSIRIKKYYQSRIDYYFNLLEKEHPSETSEYRSNIFSKIIEYGKKEPEKIRYYCCGELGPKHYRPHFHLLFWFNDQITLSEFGEALSESWAYGRVDYSMSRGDAASYVASYINSSVDLPQIFKSRQIRPKCYHSLQLGEKVFESPYEKILENDHIGAVTTSIPLNGNNTTLSMWRSLKARFMPICKGYNQKTYAERLYSYTLYGKVASWTGKISSYLQAKQLTSFVLDFGFDTFESYKYFHVYEPKFMFEILKYFKTSMSVDSCRFDSSGSLISVKCSYKIYSSDFKDYHYKFVEHKGQNLKDFLLQSFYRELRISQSFIELCNIDDYHYHRKTLNMINDFYSTLEVQKMNDNYRNIEEILEQDLMTIDEIYAHYTNLDWFYLKEYQNNIQYVFNKTPLMRMLKTKASNDFQKSIKHKIQNDLNKIFLT